MTKITFSELKTAAERFTDHGKKLSETVRAARARLGWHQFDLGKRAGIDRRTVSTIESGRHSPSFDVACDVLAALGYRVEFVQEDPTNGTHE